MAQYQQSEVVVVGGGPAGATAAYLLAKQGFRVDLFERKAFPRPKLCAGLLTWKTIALLETLAGEPLCRLKTKGLLSHTCNDYRIFFKQREIGRGRLDFPFHFVQRAEYDQWWLQTARRAGAKVYTGAAVIDLDPKHRRLITTGGHRVQAGVIIGADSALSLTRKASLDKKLRKQWRRNLAMTLEIRQPCSVQPPSQDYASLHFGYVPWGYAWSFPGREHRIIGMVSLRHKDEKPFKTAFTQFYATVAKPHDPAPGLHSHPLPYGNYLRRPSHNRILLVGDACGLADPLLGEGIYYAHRSAMLAAQAIGTAGSNQEQVDSLYAGLLDHHVLSELRWIHLYRNLLFWGGRKRRYRGLRLLLRLFPKRLEATIQGKRSFARLLFPGNNSR